MKKTKGMMAWVHALQKDIWLYGKPIAGGFQLFGHIKLIEREYYWHTPNHPILGLGDAGFEQTLGAAKMKLVDSLGYVSGV
jgi:hypothetical protein